MVQIKNMTNLACTSIFAWICLCYGGYTVISVYKIIKTNSEQPVTDLTTVVAFSECVTVFWPCWHNFRER